MVPGPGLDPDDGGPVTGVAAVGRVAPFMSFFTLVAVAVVPPAAALYVVITATWSAVERAVLYR
jgi:YidC/Oxa1 family membrane protein insertase